MPTPHFARTAIASAVSIALIGAPVAIGAPASGSTALTTPTQPAPTAMDDPSSTAAQPDDDPDQSEDDQSEDDQSDHDQSADTSTLPAGSFTVRKAIAEDTFALFSGGSRFTPDDPDFTHRDITFALPNIDGETRDFVLVEGSALNIVTKDGLADVPYAPAAHGNGDRTFAFDVSENGTIGDVRETSPDPGDEGDDEENGDGSPSPNPDPTEPGPTPAPTPTGTPDPTPGPTRSPSPEPTDDPRDDGSDRGDGNDSGSGDGPGSDDGLTEDPSSGNGADSGSGSSAPGPGGDRDWVPTTPRRPDYTDPVPQPPGADGDDSITPDSDASAPADGEDDADSITTDSASDDDGGAAMPWQIAVVVGIGAAAVAFILLVAGRRRAD